jgi:hypothetical protein
VLRAAFRRLILLLAVVVGGTAAVSAALGALAGASVSRSLATGYYVIGAAVLVGSLVLGMRGPWRADGAEDDAAPLRSRGRRRMRKATAEERSEAKRSSLGLFALGVALLLLGAAVDPSRRAF